MFKRELAAYVGTLLFGGLAGMSSLRGCPVLDGPGEARAAVGDLKSELLDQADLWRVHNDVFASVGQREWEDHVKPHFLSAITWRTIADTNKMIPTEKDIVNWVRGHPQEAREILIELGRRASVRRAPERK